MLSLFRFLPSKGPVDLALGMAGVRLGERMLYVGAGIPVLFAKAAGKVGLTGQASAVVASPAEAAVLEAAAVREGVLVEVAAAPPGSWPCEAASFDVAIVDGNQLLSGEAHLQSALCADVLRAVRAGGRVLVVHSRPRGWIGRLGFETGRPADGLAQRITEILNRAGFGPVRFLADREGLTFVEAFRPRSRARDIVPS